MENEIKMNAEHDYTGEQGQRIDDLLHTIERGSGIVCEYVFSDEITQRGPKKFAIFGSIAYDVSLSGSLSDEESHFEYQPVVFRNGKMLLENPEEGESGILYLMRALRRRDRVIENPAWIATFLACGWLRTAELKLSDAEITNNISAEIARGETPITGGR